MRKQIPLKTNHCDESRPGFLEADIIVYCGDSLSGMFAYTIDRVDIATGWTEQSAVWEKGETGVLEQLHHIEQSVPFPLRGFDHIQRDDPPKTPYRRIIESPLAQAAIKKQLTAKLKNLNPFYLRAAIEAQLKKIYQT